MSEVHNHNVGNLKNRRKAHVTFVQGRHPLTELRVAAFTFQGNYGVLLLASVSRGRDTRLTFLPPLYIPPYKGAIV